MQRLAIIGFGEAGSTFAAAFAPEVRQAVCVYDRKTHDAAGRAAQLAAGARIGVRHAENNADALRGADAVLSLVTAGEALAAARHAAPRLAHGALWLDMNSVAPESKRAAAAAVDAAGGRYVDVAVMAPVYPAALAVPLLLAGPHAADGLDVLRALGFDGRIVDGDVGAAAAIKMIRSVAVKGMEAVTAECILAACAAGVVDEVLRSLHGSDPALQWERRAAYGLERMMLHGLRRADEMDEAARTVLSLGLSGDMSRATAAWQRRIGALQLPPPDGLAMRAHVLLSALEVSPA